MPRSKSLAARKHRKIKSAARGFSHARRKRVKTAKESLLHAGQYAYVGRRLKKRDLRKLWIIRLNAAARQNGLSYNQLIHKLKENKIDLDRKVLSQIAIEDPKSLTNIITSLK